MIELSRKNSIDDSNRDRPRGKSKHYKVPLQSIVLIAGKHDLEPKLLVEAFVEAWRNKKTHCGDLKIHRRSVNQDSATFLLTKGGTVISQFPINLEALRNPEPFKKYIQYIPTPKHKKENEQKQKKIDELRYGMRSVNVKARVIEVPPRILVYTRWGIQSYVSNVEIADETGLIRLSLWNHHIDRVHIGDAVEIERGYVSSFDGKPQLRLGRKGTLSVV